MSGYEVESEVQGSVWKLLVGAGDQVSQGECLMILESMKVEIPVEAPVAGKVLEVRVAAEDTVAEEQVLLVIEPS